MNKAVFVKRGGKFYIIGDKAPASVEGTPPPTDHEDSLIAD
jgi:hypothetical protein